MPCLTSASATKPLTFIFFEERRRCRATPLGRAHRLLDDHESAGQKSQAADASRIAFKQLLDADTATRQLR
jgi:hypothetical protein